MMYAVWSVEKESKFMGRAVRERRRDSEYADETRPEIKFERRAGSG